MSKIQWELGRELVGIRRILPEFAVLGFLASNSMAMPLLEVYGWVMGKKGHLDYFPESSRIAKTLSLRLHPEVASRLLAISRATGVSRNKIVARLIMETTQPQKKLKKPRAGLLRPPYVFPGPGRVRRPGAQGWSA